MRVLEDFKCPDGHLFESLVNRGTQSVRCKECDNTAQRQRSVPNFQLNGADPGYPTAYDKWAKDHEKGAGKTYP